MLLNRVGMAAFQVVPIALIDSASELKAPTLMVKCVDMTLPMRNR